MNGTICTHGNLQSAFIHIINKTNHNKRLLREADHKTKYAQIGITNVNNEEASRLTQTGSHSHHRRGGGGMRYLGVHLLSSKHKPTKAPL